MVYVVVQQDKPSQIPPSSTLWVASGAEGIAGSSSCSGVLDSALAAITKAWVLMPAVFMASSLASMRTFSIWGGLGVDGKE